MSFNQTYEQALAKRQASDARKRSQPRKQMKRTKMAVRRVSKKATVDGDSAKAIKDECDELVRKIIRLRDKKCVTFDCPRTLGLHVSHYIKRGVLALRWSLQNCNGACDPCNELHNTDPKPYQNAMILRYGIGVSFRIEEIGRTNPRLEYVDLLAIRDGLRLELERVKK